MSHRFTIDALKELIVARRDSEQGLRICAEHVRRSRLRASLLSHLQECAQALQELHLPLSEDDATVNMILSESRFAPAQGPD